MPTVPIRESGTADTDQQKFAKGVKHTIRSCQENGCESHENLICILQNQVKTRGYTFHDGSKVRVNQMVWKLCSKEISTNLDSFCKLAIIFL